MPTATRGLINGLTDGSLLPAEDVNLISAVLEVTVTDTGRAATGHVRVKVNPNDGDTLTVTVAGTAVVYEFDNNANVGAGNIAVAIAGTPAENTANLAAALAAQQGTVLVAAQHGVDTTVVDVRVNAAGATFALAESTAGARLGVQDNAEELAEAALFCYSISRAITAEDVTRGRVRISTSLSAFRAPWPAVQIRTSAGSQYSISWDGVLTISGGLIELDNSGAQDWAAGNVIDVLAVGTKA